MVATISRHGANQLHPETETEPCPTQDQPLGMIVTPHESTNPLPNDPGPPITTTTYSGQFIPAAPLEVKQDYSGDRELTGFGDRNQVGRNSKF
jgi:hypothetical protein